MDAAQCAGIIEAILFVANGPVALDQLTRSLDSAPPLLEEALALLAERYAGGGLRLQRKPDGLQLVTAPEAAAYVERYLGVQNTGKLSGAAMETLAIIAYREPITRAGVEAVRGVNSDGVLGTLLSRGLIREAGRLESVGHPILYATTFQFLQQFGLSSVADLPPIDSDGQEEEKSIDGEAVDRPASAA